MLNFRTGQGRLTKTGRAKSPGKASLTPLSISYEKLLPMIQGFVRLQVARPIGTDPSTEIIARDVSSIKNMVTQQRHAELLRAASICERINSIRPRLTREGLAYRWDNHFPTSRSHPDTKPHRDALILSLEIGDFDVRRILVDPGSLAILCKHRSLAAWTQSHRPRKPWTNPVRIQRVVNYVLGRHYINGQADPVLSTYNFWWYRLIALQCHLGAHMATLHESTPLHISSNGKFPYKDGQVNLYGSQLAFANATR
ncbi:hypothetical protein CK203_000655 [Vitis vinifera]|uniref:Uncharacterized protein n=1 Tax=Vitis vinifera TaxID=29760 RepID=A0A438KPV4_VITVI|nr:hypothetical protein CK203_000655 [Vitis vinifera]